MHTTVADPAQMAVVTFLGHIDQLDDYNLGGWAYTRDEEAFASMQLDVYFAGRRISTISPTIKRHDLTAYFGSTQVGFTADLAPIEAEILSACKLATTFERAKETIRSAIEVQIVGTDFVLAKDLFRLGRPFSAGFSQGAMIPQERGANERDPAQHKYKEADATIFPLGELAWQFDAKFYLETQPDVERSGIDAIWHYESFGEREGRKPNRIFDPSFYRRVYADVREADINALRHYRDQGRFTVIKVVLRGAYRRVQRMSGQTLIGRSSSSDMTLMLPARRKCCWKRFVGLNAAQT
jgi:hypothetical protein